MKCRLTVPAVALWDDQWPFDPFSSPGPARFGPSLPLRRCSLLSVDADRPLKELFRLRPRDLLGLIGDAGAALVSTQVVELASLSRRVDTVLRLRRGRQSYIRHLEFAMKYRKVLEFRCFSYAALLVMRYRVPVLTTVVLVKRSGPREVAFREVLGGQVVQERRFDVVRLWEIDPERALRLGPGGAALVGAAEGTTLPLLARAARKIQRETEGVVQSDLLFILQALSVVDDAHGPGRLVHVDAVEDAVEGHGPARGELDLEVVVGALELAGDERARRAGLALEELEDLGAHRVPRGTTSGPVGRRRTPRPSRKAKPKAHPSGATVDLRLPRARVHSKKRR
jgi:hypothetical protein